MLHVVVGIFGPWKKIAVPAADSQFTNTSSIEDATPFSFPFSPKHQAKLQLPSFTTLASHLTLFHHWASSVANLPLLWACGLLSSSPEVLQIRGAGTQQNLR